MADIVVSEDDIIAVPEFVMGHRCNSWKKYKVVNFRNTLGIFQNPQDETAGSLTPLCELYERGPDSENKYIPNYGEYTSNMIPMFILLAENAE